MELAGNSSELRRVGSRDAICENLRKGANIVEWEARVVVVAEVNRRVKYASQVLDVLVCHFLILAQLLVILHAHLKHLCNIA